MHVEACARIYYCWQWILIVYTEELQQKVLKLLGLCGWPARWVTVESPIAPERDTACNGFCSRHGICSHQSNVLLMELDFVVHSCEYYVFEMEQGNPLISIKKI